MSPEVEALVRELAESNNRLAELEAEAEQIKLEREGDRREYELKIEDLENHHKFIQVSRHHFSDGFREGILTLGIQDRIIIDLIKEHQGESVANLIKDGLYGSSDSSNSTIAQTVSYFESAARAVIHKYWDGEEINTAAILYDPYKPQHYAAQLFSSCKSFFKRLDDDDHLGDMYFDCMAMLIHSCIFYHKMVVSLIERPALNRLKQSAKGRTKFTDHERQCVIAVGRDVVGAWEGKIKKTPIANLVMRKVKKQYSENNIPSVNTVIDWLEKEGILATEK